MAGIGQRWRSGLAAGALALSAGVAVHAQVFLANTPLPRGTEIQAPQSGSLSGRITDLHSVPLEGVAVALRNRDTGALARTVTGRNGSFRFAQLAAGEYTLEADQPRLGHAQLDGIQVTGGMEARVQAAMQFAPAAPAPEIASALAIAAEPSAKPAPASAAALPAVSRATLSTLSPLLTTSIAPLPLRTLNPAPRPLATTQPNAPASPPQQPQPAVQPQQPPETANAQSAAPAQPAAARLPPRRATLATQPIGLAPALAPAVPRSLPLTPVMPRSVPFDQALASGMQAALMPGQADVSPVAAAVQQANPSTADVATTVTAAQLQSLPAGGRQWQQFLQDTPAANSGTASSQPTYRGSVESAEMTIDGSNRTLKFGAAAGTGTGLAAHNPAGEDADQQGATNQSWTGGRGFGISEAAVREVKAVSGNVEAEGVRSAGGRTSIETERGGDALHGQGFYYDLQNSWGARNPSTLWTQNTGTTAAPSFAPIPFTPPDHETVWGLGMGSRVRGNKLFWFGALDSYRRNDPGLAMAREPITNFSLNGSAYCSGLLCAPSNEQALLLSAQLNESASQATSDYFGIPGSAAASAGLEQLASLLAPAPRSARQWTGFGRIDWQATERHHFTLEGIGADWNAPGGGLTNLSETYGSHSFGSSHASQQWLLARWEAYLTPNLLAETQGSVGRTILTAPPDTPSGFEQGFLAGNVQLPEIVVDSSYGFTMGNPSRFGPGSYPDEKLFHAQQMLDWAHNHLLVKAGVEFDHDADAASLLRNQNGTYHYARVANFISDALAYLRFGLGGALDPANPHNCDATGKPWYTTTGQLMGLGSLPCYSSYSQTMGPASWRLSTNDWAGFTTAEWQAGKSAVFSAGLRWEREQLPPPIEAIENPQLPFTQKLPNLGNNWGPRVGLALGSAHSRWPVLSLGYGMYYGRVANATIMTALTQTGSLKGDLYFFMRPQDDCQFCAGGAPPFPYVLTGEPASVVKPGAVGFAPNFRNPEVHQAAAFAEQKLPGSLKLTVGGMLSLGRHLPISIDTNVNTAMGSTINGGITYDVCDQIPYSAQAATSSGQTTGSNGRCGNLGQGPIKTTQITVPYFYASWPGSTGASTCPYYTPAAGNILLGRLCPDYQAITQIFSKANSTYEAAVIRLVRYGSRGLSFHAYYTFAHATDWNPRGVTFAPGSDVVDPNPANFNEEYGNSDLDVRHSAAVMAVYETPWKMRDWAGRLGNGWMLSGIGQFRSGLPYSMRIVGSLPEEFTSSGAGIVGLGSSLNGYGGDTRYPGLPRNTFRYPDTWKADLRLAKRFNLGEMRQLELMAETFNLFNHENVTEIETNGYTLTKGSPPTAYGGASTPPSITFLTGLFVSPKTGLASSAFGQPFRINGTNFYRERQIQLGLRMRF